MKDIQSLSYEVRSVRVCPLKEAMDSDRGYIALISAIIISALLLIITFAVNFSSFFARFNILDSEYKKISLGLAEACVDTAILEIARDVTWQQGPGGTVVNVGSNSCKICEVDDTSDTPRIIVRARALYNKAFTNLKIKIHPEPLVGPTDIVVDSWEEETNYPPASPSCPLP